MQLMGLNVKINIAIFKIVVSFCSQFKSAQFLGPAQDSQADRRRRRWQMWPLLLPPAPQRSRNRERAN